MEIRTDVGTASLSKEGEEVCGDTIQLIETKESTTVILSDGLGSGSKASILSILSTKIASSLIETKLGVEEVFTTIANTLPICQWRGIAYSTLSILQINNEGEAHLIEYDNPSLILVRRGEVVDIEKEDKNIAGKEVKEANFQLELGDVLILVTDGVINAGVGGLFPLGLGKDRLIDKILPIDMKNDDSWEIANKIINLTDAFYKQKPGDDSTAVVLKAREVENLVVFTGPPKDKRLDNKVVDDFINHPADKRAVCGGTTAQIVARELDETIDTNLEYFDTSVPPSAEINGIDLVTEGILTLNKSLEKLKQLSKARTNLNEKDAATRLVKHFLEADKIIFLMGKAVNPAHEDLMRSMQIRPRNKTVGRIIKKLQEIGKEIEIEVY
ncbi:MAG: SpoIIE family protein phosphatase [Bacillota bacterium]